MDTAVRHGTRKGRPNYSTDFKRRLAAAACAPNVSVSKLALGNGVNANMVFKWRRQYRAGLLGADAEPAFLPVAVEVTASRESVPVAAEVPALVGVGTIEITIGEAVMRLQGEVDARVLCTVIQSLRS
jgi:transposase